MNVSRILFVALVAGLLTGHWTLKSAEAAVPPIEWDDLAFVFIGSTIGVAFVVGFQILLKQSKPAKFFSWFFGVGGIYAAASGLAAFSIAAFRGPIAPSSLLFLAMGIGMIVGATIAGRIHRAVVAT